MKQSQGERSYVLVNQMAAPSMSKASVQRIMCTVLDGISSSHTHIYQCFRHTTCLHGIDRD